MDIQKLQARKDELWTFMWEVKQLPKLLDEMQISGTRAQIGQMEKMLAVIKEME